MWYKFLCHKVNTLYENNEISSLMLSQSLHQRLITVFCIGKAQRLTEKTKQIFQTDRLEEHRPPIYMHSFLSQHKLRKFHNNSQIFHSNRNFKPIVIFIMQIKSQNDPHEKTSLKLF